MITIEPTLAELLLNPSPDARAAGVAIDPAFGEMQAVIADIRRALAGLRTPAEIAEAEANLTDAEAERQELLAQFHTIRRKLDEVTRECTESAEFVEASRVRRGKLASSTARWASAYSGVPLKACGPLFIEKGFQVDESGRCVDLIHEPPVEPEPEQPPTDPGGPLLDAAGRALLACPECAIEGRPLSIGVYHATAEGGLERWYRCKTCGEQFPIRTRDIKAAEARRARAIR